MLLLLTLGVLIATSRASIIPATPTYALATPGIVTAHSDQVFIRNHNRLYVPTTLTATRTLPLPLATHPSYTYTTNSYPQFYRYGGYPYVSHPYPGYGYSYGYDYAGAAW